MKSFFIDFQCVASRMLPLAQKRLTNNITIRKAVAEDCEAMLALINELAVYEKAPEEVIVSLAHFTESGFGNKPVWWAYVAEADGFLVGMALYYIRYSTWKGQMLYLEDLVITESWRRKGIGTRLMDAVIADGKSRGLYGMTWQVLDWNAPAISFYEGYNARMDPEWLNALVRF